MKAAAKCLVIRTPARCARRHTDCMTCADQYSEAVGSCQPRLQRWVDRSRRWLARAALAGELHPVRRRRRQRHRPVPRLRSGSAAQRVGVRRLRRAAARCSERRPARLRRMSARSAAVLQQLRAVPLCVSARSSGARPEIPQRARLRARARRAVRADACSRASEPLPEAIVPVPLAPRRYRQRGYNQASELALSIRRATGVAVKTDVAIRQRETAEQAGLDRKARRRNVTRRVCSGGAVARAARRDPRRRRHDRQHGARAGAGAAAGGSGADRSLGDRPNAGYWLKRYSSAMPMNTDMPK